MKNSPGSLKLKYALFVATMIVTIIASLLIILYSLDQQNEDAKLINLAGRQRMLSQRISKLMLFLYYADESEISRKTYSFDSLQMHMSRWKSVHYYLIDQNKKERKSEAIAQLLNTNTPRLEKIYNVCEQAIKKPTKENLRFAIDEIATVDRPFLLTMEETVRVYQKEAEDKLSQVKKVITGLCLLAMGIFIMEFIFVFYPALSDLSKSNKELSDLNKQLSVANNELMATEEEIRTNIEQIHELKDHLEISEKQFRELVDDATDMIYELSADGKFSFANPIMEKVTGFTKAELSGKMYYDLVLEDDRETVVHFYRVQMEKREPVSYLEFRIKTKAGKILWVGQNAKMFFTDKWVYKVSVVSRDITEIKKIETQLKRERMLLRTIIDNIPVNIYVKDLQSRKILANKKEYEHMGGKVEADILGKSDWDLYPAESAKISVEEDLDVFAGNAIINLETFNFQADGTEKWFLVSKIPLRDENNLIIGLVGVSIDISETKKARELLQEAKEKAEEATLAKSRFLGMMSHEIRTPLNGIMGLTNLLNENNPRPDQKENLKLLKFSCDNLLTIINDILDFNKIEAGKMELESIPFNLTEILEQYHKMLGVRATEKGIELRLKLDKQIPNYVLGDPVRLGQVLNNLIGNAIKFTEKGYVEIAVSKVESHGKSNRINFLIKDTGIGIPQDKIDAVFSGFTQASSDTTRKFGGTGLGLSITKKLLELMGTQIAVKSELGHGSEFSFELMLTESEGVMPVKVDERQNDAELEGLHILVVDDNRVNQIVATNFLAKWGHEVTTASSGAEALHQVDENKFDLILMDLQMPEKDGFQTTIDLRKKTGAYFQEVPIIALTADVLPEVKEKVYQSGMNDYLSKPFQAADLLEIIKKHAKRKLVASAKKNNPKSRIEEVTHGDQDYAKELARLITANLGELRSALYQTLETADPASFDNARHKLKTTLFILNDDRINSLLAKIDLLIDHQIFEMSEELGSEFNNVVETLIQELA